MDMTDVYKVLDIATSAVQNMKKEINKYRWIEITPDNEEEVYNAPIDRLVIANIINGQIFYTNCLEMSISIATMAKYGGYYYYVLPELKLE